MTIHNAWVEDGASVASDAVVWDGSTIRTRAVIGPDTVIGRGVYIGAGVSIGARNKIQNLAQIYEGAVLEDGVFVGPAAVLTNDRHPRALNPDGTIKSTEDWTLKSVTLRYGSSIGARSVCVAPLSVGRWATVAAGAVVVDDVLDYALVAGVPARQIGWVGPAGAKLIELEGKGLSCPLTGSIFRLVNGQVQEDL